MAGARTRVLSLLLAVFSAGGGASAQDSSPWFPTARGTSWTYLSSAGETVERLVVGDTLVAGELYAVVEETGTEAGMTGAVVRYYVRADAATGRLLSPPGLGRDASALAPCRLDPEQPDLATCTGAVGKPESFRVAVGSVDRPNGEARVLTFASELGLDIYAYVEGEGPSLFTSDGELYALVDAVVPAEEQPDQVTGVGVWPNPSRGHVTVSHPAQPGGGTLEVFDVLGRRVLSSPVLASSVNSETSLVLPRSPGLYVVRVRGSDGKLIGAARVTVVR